MSISVAMASYNGEEYIEEQIRSICDQLDQNDELVVSDDGSNDNTLDIIRKLQGEYKNIRIIKGPQKGFVANFGNAIVACRNEIVFLSDQDDIWTDDKVVEIKRLFTDSKVKVVLHDGFNYINGKCKGNLIRPYRKGFFRNLLMSSYWGCCMAFRKDFVIPYLPFRDDVVGHDQLIGLLSEKENGTLFFDKKLIKHRFHNNNKSGKQPFIKGITFRLKLLRDYINAKT